MDRIYHHYKKWEDWRHGFYDNCSGSVKKGKIIKVLEMFNSKQLTKEYMQRVVNEWVYSCQHNFTNMTLNRIAYLGQAACCLYGDVPSTITMEAWSLLDKDVQNRADNIAQEIINNWELNNKQIQLCLNID